MPRTRPPPSNRKNDRGESGSATILGAVCVAGLMSITVGFSAVGAVVIARHRAQAAADLAALGGAGLLTAGPAAACGRARDIATAMRGASVSCDVDGLDLVVTVEVVAPVGNWVLSPARAAARAGPATD